MPTIKGIFHEGFVPADERDLKLSADIIDTYHRMRSEQKDQSAPYRTGEMWGDIFAKEKKDFYFPLINHDIPQFAKQLANFFRTSAIVGLWEGGPWEGADYPPLMESEKRQIHFIEGTLRNLECWQVLMQDSLNAVALPNVGNPFAIEHDGAFISTAQLKLHYHASQVMNLVTDIKNPVVVEIGGGFGGIGYYLFKMGFEGTYIDLDLPETLVLAIYFLSRSFPKSRVTTRVGSDNILASELQPGSLVLGPNYMLPKLPDQCADVVVNTRSFSEMERDTLQEYMRQIDRIGKRYLHHDNANVPSNRYEIPAHEFPIPASFKLLMKVKSLWYGHIENKFAEFLYEKVR